MSVGFDSHGVGSGDIIVTGVTNAASTRSWSMWLYRDNTAANLARVFDKFDSGGVEDILFYSTGSSVYRYYREHSTARGEWQVAEGAEDAWVQWVITYDDSDNGNNPIIYMNGSSVTVTENNAPSGTPQTSTDPQTWGNRGSDSGRVFDGQFAEMGIWERILSPSEAAGLGTGYSPSFYPDSLVSYIDGVRPVVERMGAGVPTVTGTAAKTHPPKIKYPAPPFISYPTAAAAANAPTGHLLGPLYGPLGGPIAA